MTRFPDLLRLLESNGVAFIVVGGSAATAHGSARLTLDLDIVYQRTPQNRDRIVAELESIVDERRKLGGGE